MTGEAEPVTKAYTKSIWDRQELQNLSATGEASESLKATAKSGKYTLGGDTLRIVSVDIVDAVGKPIGHVTSGDDLRIRIQWEGETEHRDIYASMRLDSARIQAIAAVEGYDVGAYLDRDSPLTHRGAITYCVPKVALGEGMYWVSASLCRHMLPKSADAILHYIEKACQFTVGRNSLWHFSVVYDPKFEWAIEKVPDAPLLNSGVARTDPWRERLKAFFDVRSQAVDQAVDGVPTVQDLCFIAGREPRIWCEPAVQEDLACSILTALNVDVQSTVLEVGSAAGFLAKLVAPHVGSFVGVDLSEDSLDVARSLRLPNARFLQADGGALPFPDESFDGVFCYDVFTNFPNFLDGESLIREMIRVVKRGKHALAGSIPDLSKTAEIAARFAEVTKELEARYGPLPDRTASVAAATSNSPVMPEVVCYYFAKGDFRALGERLGVETSIAEVHPLNPYYGMRFDVIFTRR